MRLRNIPRAESVLEACKEVVKDPESLRTKKTEPWHMGCRRLEKTDIILNQMVHY